MAKFQFRDYSLTLEFPGHEFTIICNSDMGDTVRGMSSQFDTIRKDYTAGNITKEDAVDHVLLCIDRILGAGASEKIFDGRDRTLSDATDVFIFIMNEATAHLKKMSPGAGNREWPLVVVK